MTTVNTQKINSLKVNIGEEISVKDIPAVVINLDSRRDRLGIFMDKARRNGLGHTGRFSAIDGKRLVSIQTIESIFKGNVFGYRRAVLGCALSHMNVWNLIQDNDMCLVMEDDIDFCPDFEKKYSAVISSLQSDDNWDICFLGYSVWKDIYDKDTYRNQAVPGPVIKAMEPEKYMGGLYGYLLRGNTAKYLLNALKLTGSKVEIDNFVMQQSDKLRLVQTIPHIIYSEHVSSADCGVDSDIQYDGTPIRNPE